MGCTQSKIENEETVNPCKDRKMFMKESVSARNAIAAAAHFAYTMSLKNTGAALSDYPHGEVDVISSSSLPTGGPTSTPQAPYDNLPSPPLPNFTPLQCAASMPVLPKPDLKPHSDPILEEENEEDEIERKVMVERSKMEGNDGGIGGRRNGKAEVEPEMVETVMKPLIRCLLNVSNNPMFQ